MANAILWESISSSTIVSSGASLSDNTMSAASTEYTNRASRKVTAWFEFTGSWATAPDDAHPTLDIYIQEDPSDSNYVDPPSTAAYTEQQHMFRVAIPVRKVTSAQRIFSRKIEIDPVDFQTYVLNQTGQTLGSGWGLVLYVSAKEIQ